MYFCFLYSTQGPPQPAQPYKFTILENCDRIKEEFNFLQTQYHRCVLTRRSEQKILYRNYYYYYYFFATFIFILTYSSFAFILYLHFTQLFVFFLLFFIINFPIAVCFSYIIVYYLFSAEITKKKIW